MKKSINLFIALLGAYTLSAQCPEVKEGEPKGSDVTTAYNICNLSGGADNDPVKAAGYIDRAIKHEKNKAKSKTWRYRGDIYLIMAQDQPNLCSEALNIAKESYIKAKELDKKNLNADQINAGLDLITTTAYNTGLEGYQSEDFEKAAKNFDAAAMTKKDSGVMDSLFMFASFNAGLSYESLGDVDKAIEKYTDCITTGYEAKQCHYRIIGALSGADRGDESMEWIKKGKAAYPDEPEFLIQETNRYLEDKNYEKAESNLTKAIEQDPSNAMLQFVLGTAMDQLGKTEGATAAYKKAIEIDPDYLDAYHNLGASYVNASVAMKEEINELDFRKDQAQIAALEKESDSALKNALPYLEKALELEPNNIQVMNSLKSIYFAFEQMDKYNAMKSRMDSAK